jgi:hypothetical protein
MRKGNTGRQGDVKNLTECQNKIITVGIIGPPLWSSGQSFWLATDPKVLGSIPGASRFSERQWVWNGVHSAS